MMTPLEILKERRLFLKEKHDNLQQWLLEHPKHDDFLKIAGDRNAVIVKMDAIDFKISQVEKGLPILGEPEDLKTIIDLEKFRHRNLNK